MLPSDNSSEASKSFFLVPWVVVLADAAEPAGGRLAINIPVEGFVPQRNREALAAVESSFGGPLMSSPSGSFDGA